MNAAIRAVVRAAIYHDLKVTGILRGYEGLINADFIEMDRKSVANIIQRGGTILKTARSDNFRTKEGRKKAFEQSAEHHSTSGNVPCGNGIAACFAASIIDAGSGGGWGGAFMAGSLGAACTAPVTKTRAGSVK